MKLGFLTAPFPETPLMDVADWAAGERLRGPRDRLLAARDRPDPPLRRHEPHRRREPVGGQATRDRRRDRGQGPRRSPASATTPTRSIPTRRTATQVIGHLKQVIAAAEKMGVPLVNTFMGGDGAKNQDQNWEEALRVWPDIVAFAERPRPRRSRSRTARCCSATTSGRAATTSRPRPRMWRRILEQWGGTIGLNFDPSHLILQMIDIRRFIREFGPHILHFQAKDLMIDRDGLYERGIFSMGIGWQIPRIPGLGEVDWGVVLRRAVPARATRATASSSTRTATSRGPTSWSSGASCIARDVLRPVLSQ